MQLVQTEDAVAGFARRRRGYLFNAQGRFSKGCSGRELIANSTFVRDLSFFAQDLVTASVIIYMY